MKITDIIILSISERHKEDSMAMKGEPWDLNLDMADFRAHDFHTRLCCSTYKIQLLNFRAYT